MKKIIGILIIFVIVHFLAHFIGYLCSTGETPQATNCHEREWHGRDGELGYRYTFYTYYLLDESRQCHIGSPETFHIVKKEARINRDDHCDHCNMMWSWHFKK